MLIVAWQARQLDEKVIYRKWVEWYGNEMAAAMKSLALANLDDYGYLMPRKV